MPDVGSLGRAPDRAKFAIVNRREQLERLGAASGCPFVVAEQSRAVDAERGDHRAGGSAKRPHVRRIGFGKIVAPALEHAREPLGPARLAARRAAHESDELVVDKQRARSGPLTPARVDVGRKWIVEFAVQRDIDLTAHDMMIEHEAGI